MKRVAILMSTYNGEKYIREQIDSILGQTGDIDIELWVRDDGSTDGTTRILDEYSEKNKLKWYTAGNLGAAKSFFDLLYKCGEYDYYAFADQDDVWECNKISVAVKQMGEYKQPALYFGNAELVDEKLESISIKVYNKKPKLKFETLTCAGGLLGCTMVLNNLLVSEIRKSKMPEDVVMHDFYVALVCAGLDGTIIYDADCYIKYRQHGNNVVGVSYGIIGKIKERTKIIAKKSKISISKQANDIYIRYAERFSNKNADWLKRVSEYRNTFNRRISLACSLKTHYINLNKAITIRLAILLGNR